MAVNWAQNNGWFIQAGPAHVFRRNHASSFGLSKQGPVGGRDSYLVTFTPATTSDAGGMDAIWTNCLMIERGSTPLEWTADPLPPFDPTSSQSRMDYSDAINSVMPSANADTLRLVGEVKVGSKMESVIFVLAQNALLDGNGNKQDLLIILISTRFGLAHDLVILEDGTGHGRPN